MVFPSLSFHVETGLISQFSTLILIGFSILLNYWKRVALYLALIVTIALSAKTVFAWSAVPSGCGMGTSCMNNSNYYGTPWVRQPAYFYPSLNYHSFWGPSPSYYRSHGQSPYRPQWMNNCPHCGNNNWQNVMPQSPGTYHGPGMPAS